jgi:hypothetical protein
MEALNGAQAALAAGLVARGVAPALAIDAALLCAGSSATALALACASTGACAWRELHSTRYAGRPYYHNKETGATTWEACARANDSK